MIYPYISTDHFVFRCFVTVDWAMFPVKIVAEMTCYVSGGTLTPLTHPSQPATTCVMHAVCCVCLWSHNSRGRLADMVAEHLDHMHYLNDILSLDISALNDVLTEHLLNRLLLPLYVFSLVDSAHGAPESVCYTVNISLYLNISLISTFWLNCYFLPRHNMTLLCWKCR